MNDILLYNLTLSDFFGKERVRDEFSIFNQCIVLFFHCLTNNVSFEMLHVQRDYSCWRDTDLPDCRQFLFSIIKTVIVFLKYPLCPTSNRLSSDTAVVEKEQGHQRGKGGSEGVHFADLERRQHQHERNSK